VLTSGRARIARANAFIERLMCHVAPLCKAESVQRPCPGRLALDAAREPARAPRLAARAVSSPSQRSRPRERRAELDSSS
jgi:hypothetical protein